MLPAGLGAPGNGKYPLYATEVVYPGMHSDIGGGYPPGDQGKANGEDDALLLSQIALHDMRMLQHFPLVHHSKYLQRCYRKN